MHTEAFVGKSFSSPAKIAAELKTYEDAAKSIDETLERMGLGYLDQIIIHSPQPWSEFRVEKRYFEENKEVWRALRVRGRRQGQGNRRVQLPAR